MLPSPNELRCIEIARVFRVRREEEKLAEFNRRNSLHLHLQNARRLADLEDGWLADPEMPVRSVIFLIIFFSLYPLMWITLFFSKLSRQKIIVEQRKVLQEQVRKAKMECEVSENKSFVQLWSDRGLRDYGLEYLDKGRFSIDEKRYCISEWVKILYHPSFDLKAFEDKVRERNREQVQEMIRKEPGIHVTLADPINLVPFVIDRFFGKYEVEEVKQEFSEN